MQYERDEESDERITNFNFMRCDNQRASRSYVDFWKGEQFGERIKACENVRLSCLVVNA